MKRKPEGEITYMINWCDSLPVDVHVHLFETMLYREQKGGACVVKPDGNLEALIVNCFL